MPILRCLLACLFTLVARADAPASPLFGRWTGSGRFLNAQFQKCFGPLPFELDIAEDQTLTGTVGGARIRPCKPTGRGERRDYRAELEGVVRPERPLRKRRLVLLITRTTGDELEADFQLKTNFILDWSMRVGALKAARTASQ